jgi:hypothetical protein
MFGIDTLLYIALAMAAVGGAVSYVGQQKAADAAEDAGKAQKEAADAAARNEEMQTAENVRRERITRQRRLARLRSQMNAGGVVMADSSMDVFAETAGITELQVQDIGRSGQLASTNYRNDGAMSLWEARSQAAATRISSYGTLLATGSSMAGISMDYSRYRTTGGGQSAGGTQAAGGLSATS